MKMVRLSINFEEYHDVTLLFSLECYNLSVVRMCENLPLVFRQSSNHVCSRETEKLKMSYS